MRALSAKPVCGATCLPCAETGLRSGTRDRQNHAHLEHSAVAGPGSPSDASVPSPHCGGNCRLPRPRACAACARPLDGRNDVAAETHRGARDLAGRQVRRLRRDALRRRERQGRCGPVPGGDGGRQAGAAHQHERQRVRARVEPGRALHRLRRQARRRQAVAALRDRRQRRRGDSCRRRADRRLRAEVVPGLEAHRFHNRRLAGHHGLGEDTGEAEGARGLEDERDGLGPPAGHALGPFHRGPHPAPVLDRDRGRHTHGDYAGFRTLARTARSGSGLLRHLAGRHGGRLRRQHRRLRHRREPRRLRRGHDRRPGAQRHGRQPCGRRFAELQPGRPLARLQQAGDQGLLRRHAAAVAHRPQERRAWQAHRRGLGPLGERHRLGAGREELLRVGRRRRDGAHLSLRRREGHAACADRAARATPRSR